MAAFRKILLPIDLSMASRAALRFVAGLVGSGETMVHLVQVWELPDYLRPDTVVYRPGQPRRTLADIAREKMIRLRAMVEEVAPELPRAELLEFGDPERVILDLAAAGAYDLIVVGGGLDETAGDRHGSYQLFQALARGACCPVLAVPRCYLDGAGSTPRPTALD